MDLARKPIEIEIAIAARPEDLPAIARGDFRGCGVGARVAVHAIDAMNRRWRIRQELPPIAAGDITAAAETLDSLVRQRRIEPELERALDDLLPLLRDLTRPR